MFIRIEGEKPLKRKFGAFTAIWGKWGWDGQRMGKRGANLGHVWGRKGESWKQTKV